MEVGWSRLRFRWTQLKAADLVYICTHVFFLGSVSSFGQVIGIQEGKPNYTSSFQGFACIMLANISLGEANHIATSITRVAGNCILPLAGGNAKGPGDKER